MRPLCTHLPGAALVQFAAGLSDTHQSLLPWAGGSHPCGDAAGRSAPWPGVSCDAAAGSVIGLDLSSRSLGGRLDDSLSGIETLRSM